MVFWKLVVCQIQSFFTIFNSVPMVLPYPYTHSLDLCSLGAFCVLWVGNCILVNFRAQVLTKRTGPCGHSLNVYGVEEWTDGRFGYQIASLITKGIYLRCDVAPKEQAASLHCSCDDISGAAPSRDLQQRGF